MTFKHCCGQRRCARAAALPSRAYPTPFSHNPRAFPHTASPAAAVLRDTSRVASGGALARAVLTLRVALLLYTHIDNHLSVNQVKQDPMTLIQKVQEGKEDIMTDITMKEDLAKPSRPVRNRRYTRRSLVAGQRPQKRLFTPEIKRYLKDWLVRRRDNPYPNREEKKYLSRETGLTYIQICNWFANWRRKLKNVNVDRNQQTWGHLIRTYNDRAQGNVEQFSICSDDSIWSEPDPNNPDDNLDHDEDLTGSPETITEYHHDDSDASSNIKDKCVNFNNNSYKSDANENRNEEPKAITSPMLLSKWLESAARFQPSECNYSWWADGKRRKPDAKIQRISVNTMSRHDRDEVEAAVALTALASATSRISAP
ncbi:hypothetical protein HW555_006585 [Spodoptera exigua]|uniref:Homeobox domain-containing protein n=2 Tax=Spodoptera exigua TaxID=7107 RepID=A0A835GBA1_SPOEX|nr:hypothetical protein HW555_009369 [Spodoptera exigua]KAF9415953.1 hypothetical protein HW555_006585 [Spodoptera exigua]